MNTKISREIIFRDLMETKISPLLGKFLFQQYKIQKFLSSLILWRLIGNSLSMDWIKKNKKILMKIRDATIGHLIRYLPENDELCKKLNKYNERRNKIVHHQDILEEIFGEKVENYENFIKETLKLGEEIIEKLIEALKKRGQIII